MPGAAELGLEEGTATDQEVEQLYLEQLEQFYSAALDATEEYLNAALTNPIDEFQTMAHEYEFITLDNASELFSDWTNMREKVLEKKERFARKMWNYFEETLQEYLAYKGEQRDFKQDYLEVFGADQFDIDPDEPILEQVTKEDIVEDFWNNQVGRN